MKKIATAVFVGMVMTGAMVPPFAGAEEKPVSSVPKETGWSVPDETREQRNARMAWWREAKFGMFIHWGLYSVIGGEHEGKKYAPGEGIMRAFKISKAEYAQYAKGFNPASYNADEWVKMAKKAGMKYIVFTAKHTEGFAMFRTKASAFNICDATPFRRDPLAELTTACRKQGMPLGFYYAQSLDTYNDGFGNNWDRREKTTDQYFDSVAIPQIKELLSNYGAYPSIFWWDAPDGMNPQRAKQIAGLARASKPGIIMDDRLGGGFPGDFKAGWGVPKQVTQGDWEVHGSMNHASWGYIKNSSNCNEDAKYYLKKLIDIASKGGNFILNVTPDRDGLIPPLQVKCLAGIGAWLKANGEAIYGTAATPFGAEFGSINPDKKGKDGKPLFNPACEWRCTVKPGKLYVHIFKWPTGKFELPAVKDKVVKAYLLADPKHTELNFTQTDTLVAIELPPKAPDPIFSVVCLETKGSQ